MYVVYTPYGEAMNLKKPSLWAPTQFWLRRMQTSIELHPAACENFASFMFEQIKFLIIDIHSFRVLKRKNRFLYI